MKKLLTTLSILLIATATFVFLILVKPAWSCDCMVLDMSGFISKAKAVFVGTAIKKKVPLFSKIFLKLRINPSYKIDFKVLKSWKGTLKNTTRVKATMADGWTCTGSYFDVGETYLVFAFGDHLKVVKHCDPSINVENSNVEAFYEILGDPEKIYE